MSYMLYTFCTLIIFFQILIAIWNIIKIYLAYLKVKHNKKVVSNEKNNFKVVIIIPCLYEQSIIIETIEYFIKLLKKYDNIELAIITTEKEEYEYKKNNIKQKTTSELVLEYIEKNSSEKLKHFHYPNTDGMMADQLNYVVKKYNTKLNNKLYFSVYNADSRPNINTIEKVIEIIKDKKYPPIIQQYSYAFLNLDKISPLMQGFAVYQSNFEIKYGLINSIITKRFLYTYVVGHGLYIRSDLLKELNGFDNHFWCEDIFLSSRLRNRNITIVPVLALENMETPKKMSILMKQNANWFRTSCQVFKILKANYREENKITLSLFFWLFQRVCMNIIWLFLPIFVSLSFLYSLYSHKFILMLFSILSYLFMQFANYLGTITIIEKLEQTRIKNKILLIIFACISTFISNIGPLYSILNFKMKKYKTER